MACSTYGKEVDKESNLYDRHLGKRRFRLEPSRSSCFTNFFTLDVGNRTNLLQKSQVFDDRLHRGDVVREFHSACPIHNILHNTCSFSLSTRKIKLAFRPGNVDLTDAQTQAAASIAIDDPKGFGNIVPDADYPELEDAAFSQNMLSNYASLRAARGRTIASQQDTTQQEDFDHLPASSSSHSMYHQRSPHSQSSVHQSPLGGSKNGVHSSSGGLVEVGYIPGEDAWKMQDGVHSSRGSSCSGRVSDVELMRGERVRGSLSTLARSSLSSAGAIHSMRFDDDIPAFDDNMEEVAAVAAFGDVDPPQLDFYDDGGMNDGGPDDYGGDPVDDEIVEVVHEPAAAAAATEMQENEASGDDIDDGPAEESKSSSQAPSVHRSAAISEADAAAATKQQPAAVAKTSGRGKRQKVVVVDDRVELNPKVIKQRMADVNPILRRRPGSLLPRYQDTVGTSRLLQQQQKGFSVPPSVRGLCPELQSLFTMTMVPSNCRLPFALKPGATGLSAAHRRRSSGAAAMIRQPIPGSGGSRNSDNFDIEAVRGSEVLALNDGDLSRRLSSSSVVANGEEQVHSLGANHRLSSLGDPEDHDFGGDNDNMDYGYDNDDGDYALMNTFEGVDKPSIDDPTTMSQRGALLGWKGKDTTGVNTNLSPADNTSGVHSTAEWSSRTAMVFDVLQDQLKEHDSVSFNAISKGISRRTAAACFLEILQLKTWDFVDVSQDKPFSDIAISATAKFWNGAANNASVNG